ncbi:DUF3467 domain-containing protein [Mesorhizobium sp. LNHC229A00]|uniref:DUF3467 domain-containing protein n=1 Tax=Mesorhizobium sp. LNHC229A00 TaxID=1287240 RepID=UPI000A0495A8|nr:DUF3467 domain-containing protein [Mesorhizobium sp. LNHC229A00]
MANGKAEKGSSETITAGQTQPPVRLNTANLKSTYCNVCNATSTREEVVLNFGINQNWDLHQRDLEIELHHRIILSPFAAKRLQELITKLIQEYENRHGELR